MKGNDIYQAVRIVYIHSNSQSAQRHFEMAECVFSPHLNYKTEK